MNNNSIEIRMCLTYSNLNDVHTSTRRKQQMLLVMSEKSKMSIDQPEQNKGRDNILSNTPGVDSFLKKIKRVFKNKHFKNQLLKNKQLTNLMASSYE